MTVADPDLKDLERRMHGAVEVLQKEFAGLRTGRASIHLLEPITAGNDRRDRSVVTLDDNASPFQLFTKESQTMVEYLIQ